MSLLLMSAQATDFEGTWNIFPTRTPGTSLDISSNSLAQNASVVQWSAGGPYNQQFHFIKVNASATPFAYKILAVSSQMTLTAKNGYVVQDIYQGLESQHWFVEGDSNEQGYCLVTYVAGVKHMMTFNAPYSTNANQAAKVTIIPYPGSSVNLEKFRLVVSHDKEFEGIWNLFPARTPSTALEIDSNSLATDASVIQSSTDGLSNQQFHFIKASRQNYALAYKIVAVSSEKVLTVKNGSVVQDVYQGLESQHWYIEEDPDVKGYCFATYINGAQHMMNFDAPYSTNATQPAKVIVKPYGQGCERFKLNSVAKYKFVQGRDSPQGDIANVGQLGAEKLQRVCLSNPNCVAVNTLGDVKETLNSLVEPWDYYFNDPNHGIYIKQQQYVTINDATITYSMKWSVNTLTEVQAILDPNGTGGWNAGAGPWQWIQIDLNEPTFIQEIHLSPGIQNSKGLPFSYAVVRIGLDYGLSTYRELPLLTKTLTAGQLQSLSLSTMVKNVRITTLSIDSWVAWSKVLLTRF